jgi:hypothetical protein
MWGASSHNMHNIDVEGHDLESSGLGLWIFQNSSVYRCYRILSNYEYITNYA